MIKTCWELSGSAPQPLYVPGQVSGAHAEFLRGEASSSVSSEGDPWDAGPGGAAARASLPLSGRTWMLHLPDTARANHSLSEALTIHRMTSNDDGLTALRVTLTGVRYRETVTEGRLPNILCTSSSE